MRPTDNIERLINRLQVEPRKEVSKRNLDDALAAQKKANESAELQPTIWRIIMKSNITKLAVAAVIIVAIVFVINHFGGSIDGTSVVWADVVKKVEASRGTIFRSFDKNSNSNNYSIMYYTPRYHRIDSFNDGKINLIIYNDYQAMTVTSIHHEFKFYIINKYEKRENFDIEKQQDMINPTHLLGRILSCEYKTLGQKTIDGILCEGIETTDPAFMMNTLTPEQAAQVKSINVQMRLWVNIKTKYPVVFEWKVYGEAGGVSGGSDTVIDQFQWNVDIDPSIFEPNIPQDYREMGKR
jgi:hypothetical protein